MDRTRDAAGSRLGILDLGGDPAHSIELAPLADALGYTRFWIAEHQPQPSPILSTAILAGITDRIRVGTAGILFHYYPPLRTAHDFHFLERLYPGRIDAGFCGGITANAALVAEDLDGRDLAAVCAAYDQRVARLVHHLRNTRGARGFDSATAWSPGPDSPPQIWSLGTGGRSATLAAAHGLAFAYGLMFVNSRDDHSMVSEYRRSFSPRGGLAAPLAAVAVAGMCAETDADAARMQADYPGTFFAPRIVGSPQRCAAELEALRQRYQADEVIFADLCPTLEARTACYRLLAAEWMARAA